MGFGDVSLGLFLPQNDYYVVEYFYFYHKTIIMW